MRINVCRYCRVYTLKEKCGKCGKETISAHPPVFSLEKERKYGKYRRAGA
ncbi:MAG: nucleolar RNA-binding Nop10p family protein [Candidatus Aenigmarchaeota archaeon]|nr:nucleolar RNA-binding Nop10p family protein [Candidatus Aenigmarchaeota archaeon]